MKTEASNSGEARYSLLGYFVHNRKIAFLLGMIIVVWGVMSAISIPKESAPYIEYGIVSITTSYQGAAAKDIDALITQEIEGKIKSITGIQKFYSSSRNGISNITIEFIPGQDMVKALSDIRSKVDEAKAGFPNDLSNDPVITEIDSSLQPFFTVVLSGPYANEELRDYAESLKKEIEQVPDVARVNITGGAEREIRVFVDQKKAEALGISLDQIISIIASSNKNTPIGDFEIDRLNYSLRFEGEYQNADDIRSLALKNLKTDGSTPSLLRVSDIATVEEQGEDTDSFFRFGQKDGENTAFDLQNAVQVSVSRRSKSDIFAIDTNTRNAITEFTKTNFPGDIRVEYITESAPIMKKDFQEVLTNGAQSVLVVLLILFLFIGIREALVSSLIIPFAILMTIGILMTLGKTLNFMTNFSMILSLGILVDTAIVITEGMHDYIKKGYSRKESAILTIKEFFGPLLSGTLTTLAVFIPLFVLPGILGQYLSFIPITVSIVLIASLFVSLLLIPAYASLLLPSAEEIKKRENSQSLQRRFRKFLDKKLSSLIEKYGIFLKKILSKRISRLGIFYGIMLLFVGSFFIPLQFVLFPSGDADSVSISIEKIEGALPEDVLDTAKSIEDYALKIPEVKSISTTIADNTGEVYIEFFPTDERKEKKMRTAVAIENIFEKEFLSTPDTNIQIKKASQGPPSEAPVAIRVVIKQKDFLEQGIGIAQQLTNILREVPGTIGVKNDLVEIPGEFEFIVKREEALRLGIAPDQIANMVRAAVSGRTASTITKDERNTDIIVQFDEGDIETLNDIKALPLFGQEGNIVRLEQLVEISQSGGFSTIKRQEGNIAFTVTSLLGENGNASEITAAFFEKIEEEKSAGRITIPSGIDVIGAGENEDNSDLLASLQRAFIISIFLMFFILVIQFGSYLQPLLILNTVLFAQIGVTVGLFITDTPRSLPYLIGIISLSGIVVNDAIILVNRINNLRKESKYRSEIDAIVESGKSRFIPIILTTLTTIGGIAPLVLVDVFWAGLSYTVVFGLLIASFLTLFVTPVSYLQFEHEKAVTFLPIGILIMGLVGASFLFAGNIAWGIFFLIICILCIVFLRKAIRNLPKGEYLSTGENF
jgi:multidrug efflux pump subunit AcrB